MDFLRNIREELVASSPRLSKAQRDVTGEILSQAAFGEPFAAGKAMAKLVRFATGCGRLSSFEEYFLLQVKKNRAADALNGGESAISFSKKQWRIIEEIKQKTYFGLPGEPLPIDPDGIVENDDPMVGHPNETTWRLGICPIGKSSASA